MLQDHPIDTDALNGAADLCRNRESAESSVAVSTVISVIAGPTLLPTRFPDCRQCQHWAAGAAELCLTCARQRLELPGPHSCPLCRQFLTATGNCPNDLCRNPRRRIGPIHAIAYQSGPLRQAINAYKYRGARDWSVIFGRLLLAWLDEAMAGDRPDLVVANPGYVGAGGQRFAHAEAVLDAAAAAQDGSAKSLDWRFDTAPRAIVKTAPTLKSADGEAWSKRAAANDLREALRIPDPTRTAGRFVLVYDDICTTGGQLDTVAGCLLDDGGAARVEGVVLARAPWRASP